MSRMHVPHAIRGAAPGQTAESRALPPRARRGGAEPDGLVLKLRPASSAVASREP